MTKIIIPAQWSKIAIDSCDITQNATHCTDSGNVIDKPTIIIAEATGEQIDRKENTSSHTVTVNGHQCTISKIKQFGITKFKTTLNAKALGTKKYNQGITIDNAEQLLREIHRHSQIKFTDQGYDLAEIHGVDIKTDAEITNEQWHNEIEKIGRLTQHRYKSLFEPFNNNHNKPELITGFRYNDRKITNRKNWHTPMIHGYDKYLDTLAKLAEGDKSLPGYNPIGIKRIEAAIIADYYRKNPILAALKGERHTMNDLLTTIESENEIFANFLWKGIESYQEEKIKMIRTVKAETVNQFRVRETLQRTLQNDSLPADKRKTTREIFEEVKDQIMKAYPKRTAYRAAAEMEKDWQLVINARPENQTEIPFE